MTLEWTTEPDNSSASPSVTWIILLFLSVAATRSNSDLETRLEYLSKFALTTKEAVTAVRNSAAGIQSLVSASQTMRNTF